MDDYKGVIIEESLENADVLKRVNIVSTKIEKVTERHDTPWLKQWTLHTVEIPAHDADEIAQDLSKVLDKEHNSEWYADFKNDEYHFIIFRDRVFKIDRKSREQYKEAYEYGRSIGIPEYQLIQYPG